MTEEKKIVLDYKEFLKEHGKKGTKVRRNDRKKVEIIAEAGAYKVGQVINPHKLWAEYLIKNKVAKAVK